MKYQLFYKHGDWRLLIDGKLVSFSRATRLDRRFNLMLNNHDFASKLCPCAHLAFLLFKAAKLEKLVSLFDCVEFDNDLNARFVTISKLKDNETL